MEDKGFTQEMGLNTLWFLKTPKQAKITSSKRVKIGTQNLGKEDQTESTKLLENFEQKIRHKGCSKLTKISDEIVEKLVN